MYNVRACTAIVQPNRKKKTLYRAALQPIVQLVHPFGHSVYIISFSFGIFESEVFIMKQMIIAVAALTAGAGAALLLLSRSFTGRTRKPCMTFAELYEDNICDEIGGLFD